MYAQEYDFPLCCGTKVIGNFRKARQSIWDGIKISELDTQTGIGLAVATFNNEEVNKQAYEEMKKKFNIVWESGWIPNSNMNNTTMVNLVVFETDTMEVD